MWSIHGQSKYGLASNAISATANRDLDDNKENKRNDHPNAEGGEEDDYGDDDDDEGIYYITSRNKSQVTII